IFPRVAEPLGERVAQGDVALPAPAVLRLRSLRPPRPRRRQGAIDGVQRTCLLEVIEQLVAYGRPGPPLDGLAPRPTERLSLPGIAGEVPHPHAQVVEIARSVQPPIDPHPHEIQRAPSS